MVDNISGVKPLPVELSHAAPSPRPKAEAAQPGGVTAQPTAVQAFDMERAVKGVNASDADKTAVSREELEAATKDVEEFVSGLTNDLKFSIDDDTGRQVVKIVDIKTDEVLRQIPSEEMLAIAKALDKIKGLFIKNTA